MQTRLALSTDPVCLGRTQGWRAVGGEPETPASGSCEQNPDKVKIRQT